MALKLTKKAGTATINKEVKDKGTTISEDMKNEQVETPSKGNEGPWCEVGVEMSYTHNLGNYCSARVQVSLRLPCKHEEIDEVYEYAKEWTDNKLQGLIEELQSGGDE